MKACKTCHMIADTESVCKCGGELSKEWQGYCIIIDHSNSEIAKQMGASANGKYALKVR